MVARTCNTTWRYDTVAGGIIVELTSMIAMGKVQPGHKLS